VSSNAGTAPRCWLPEKKRAVRLAKLRVQIAPLKKEAAATTRPDHRLKFEEAVANNDGDKARKARKRPRPTADPRPIGPLQKESTSSPANSG
jgi:hypothetical protein